MKNCSICRAEERERRIVDRHLDRGHSVRWIAAKTGFTKSSIYRHDQHRHDAERAAKAMPAQLSSEYKVAAREALGFSPAAARAGIPGTCGKCGAQIPQIRVVWDEQINVGSLSRAQFDAYLSQLLRRRGEMEGENGDEVLLAHLARTIAKLEREPLPPELQAEVDKILSLVDRSLTGGDKQT